MSALETFITRYDSAHRANSKEVRLQMREAKDLAHEISIMSIRNAELAEEVIKLQKKLIELLEKSPKNEDGVIEIKMDGGSFSD